jgi:hypothetical protein
MLRRMGCRPRDGNSSVTDRCLEAIAPPESFPAAVGQRLLMQPSLDMFATSVCPSAFLPLATKYPEASRDPSCRVHDRLRPGSGGGCSLLHVSSSSWNEVLGGMARFILAMFAVSYDRNRAVDQVSQGR